MLWLPKLLTRIPPLLVNVKVDPTGPIVTELVKLCGVDVKSSNTVEEAAAFDERRPARAAKLRPMCFENSK
jgi:hypothetical protein